MDARPSFFKVWSVPREWSNETAFVLGGGPSLRGFDPSVLDGRRCIATNNAWELKPDSDILYFCDKVWWEKKAPKAEHLSAYPTNGDAAKACFCGKYVVSIANLSDPFVNILRNAGRGDMSRSRGALVHGSNSGYQAINLAYLMGATRIVLLGIDMKIDGDQTHWHKGHGQDVNVVAHRLKTMSGHFPHLVDPLKAAGVEVLNCSMESALTCFPKVPLAEVLA